MTSLGRTNDVVFNVLHFYLIYFIIKCLYLYAEVDGKSQTTVIYKRSTYICQ